MKFNKISIVIPVYNEEKTLKTILNQLKKADFSPLKREVIIVDDGSIDNTKNILKTLKGYKIIFHKKNKGKGAALRTGFSYATGDIITIQDGDLEYDPAQLPILMKPILSGRYQVVFGSRFLKEHKAGYHLYYLGNLLLSFMTRLIYWQKITDMETCYKMFTKKAYEKIKLHSNGFEIEPEMTAKFINAGFKIKELPIKYKSRPFEEGKKITWMDGVKALYYLVKFKFVRG